nr:MAG TPA: hypothetical protein [Caudoviricetes sp.]
MVEHLAKNFSPAFRLQRFAGLFVVVHVVLSFHATGRLSSFFRLATSLMDWAAVSICSNASSSMSLHMV